MMDSGIILLTEVLYGVIGILGLASNFLIVYIIICCLNEKTRNLITTRCILHISLSDLLLVICLPLLISDLTYKSWPFSNLTCDFLNLTLLTHQFAKSFLLIFFSLTALAIYRGIVLDLNQIKVTFILIICWFLAFLISLFLILNGEKRGKCNLFWHENDYFTYREAFTLMYTILIFIVPGTVLTLLIREKQLNSYLDEQQLKIKQTINLVIIMLGIHTFLNFMNIVTQWMFTFDVDYERNSIKNYTIEVNRDSKSILYCIASWFLLSELFVFPLIYYRFCRKLGYGFPDLLDSLVNNRSNIQNFIHELKESQKLGQIYYKPVALYDKIKTNIKKSIYV